MLGSDVMIFDEQDNLIAASAQPAVQDAALLRVLAEARAGRRAVCCWQPVGRARIRGI